MRTDLSVPFRILIFCLNIRFRVCLRSFLSLIVPFPISFVEFPVIPDDEPTDFGKERIVWHLIPFAVLLFVLLAIFAARQFHVADMFRDLFSFMRKEREKAKEKRVKPEPVARSSLEVGYSAAFEQVHQRRIFYQAPINYEFFRQASVGSALIPRTLERSFPSAPSENGLDESVETRKESKDFLSDAQAPPAEAVEDDRDQRSALSNLVPGPTSNVLQEMFGGEHSYLWDV